MKTFLQTIVRHRLRTGVMPALAGADTTVTVLKARDPLRHCGPGGVSGSRT